VLAGYLSRGNNKKMKLFFKRIENGVDRGFQRKEDNDQPPAGHGYLIPINCNLAPPYYI
jgi:hypothetical protein